MTLPIRQAIRGLLRTPVSTIIPILILALGIGATTAIFSVVDAALLRPLPGVGHPGELVLLQRIQDGQMLGNFGYPDFLDYRAHAETLMGVAASGQAGVNYTHHGTSERIRADVVSGNYFSLLEVRALEGRLLGPDDELGHLNNAVLSFGLWTRDFGADPSVIGQTIHLNEESFTIVGVAAKDFAGAAVGAVTALWLPVTTQPAAMPYMSANTLTSRASGWLTLFGRLRPAVTTQKADSELRAIAQSLAQAYPNTNAHRTVQIFSGVGMDPDDKQRLSQFFGLLLGSVVLLLLIACGNVSSLLLARGVVRSREIAVRLAVGANRSQLMLQFLIEAVLISSAACVLALVVARELTPLILTWQPNSYGLQNLKVSIDSRVFAFAAIVAALTAIPCALAPIWQSGRLDLVHALRQGSAAAGRQTTMFRSALVAAQVALSVVLIISAGLVLRTMHGLLTADQGFETRKVALFSIDVTTSGFTPERGSVFFDQLVQRISSVPGVVSATTASTIPPSDISSRQAIFYPGQQPADIQGHEFDSGNVRVDTDSIRPGYFRTMGIALAQGRDFTTADREQSVPVAIVNESLARRMWPGEDAVGKHLAIPEFGGHANPDVEIVGVVHDIKYRSLVETPAPLIYLPALQRYNGRTTLVVRTNGDPGKMIAELIREIHSIGGDIPVYGVQTMSEHIAASMWQQQIASGLIGLFGVLALVLASAGVYGVVAQGVAERTREIGIRLALGGGASDIRRMVFKQSLRLVVSGLVLGLFSAGAATRALSSLLYTVGPHDPLTFIASCGILLLVAFIAGEIPAWRALRIDPIAVLRQE